MTDLLVGVWPAPADTPQADAHRGALLKLAGMCADYDVMPAGDSSFAVIDGLADVVWACHDLGVRLPYLLDLCRRVGCSDSTVLVAASVPVERLFHTLKVEAPQIAAA